MSTATTVAGRRNQQGFDRWRARTIKPATPDPDRASAHAFTFGNTKSPGLTMVLAIATLHTSGAASLDCPLWPLVVCIYTTNEHLRVFVPQADVHMANRAVEVQAVARFQRKYLAVLET